MKTKERQPMKPQDETTRLESYVYDKRIAVVEELCDEVEDLLENTHDSLEKIGDKIEDLYELTKKDSAFMRDMVRLKAHLGKMDLQDAYEETRKRLTRLKADLRGMKGQVKDDAQIVLGKLTMALAHLKEPQTRS